MSEAFSGNPYWNDLSIAVLGEKAPEPTWLDGPCALPSVYPVAEFAAATIGLAGTALNGGPVQVSRRLASLWFDVSLRSIGWQVPSPWDDLAGVYQTRDGWIRLHTNAPHHRARALEVLGKSVSRQEVVEAVQNWSGAELETAIVAAGGCAAQMRSTEDWVKHPQGAAVLDEPLIYWKEQGECSGFNKPDVGLKGIKILDLTRVLAGPVATRFLAGLGADVLRIDPADWNEPAVEMDVTLGKRCAGLDLRSAEGRAHLLDLMAQADVLVHGYRADALDALGLGEAIRRARNPALLDVSLNAYGWTGPWRNRRGFDSLVQMSCGIADAGQRAFGTEGPKPLPVQALDHATGYLMAACVLRALNERAKGRVLSARLSLARTAGELVRHRVDLNPSDEEAAQPQVAIEDADLAPRPEETGWGPAHRLISPITIDGRSLNWTYPAGPLRRHPACWENQGE